VIVDFGEKFLKSIPPSHLDWVYLDASHDYQNTLDELAAAITAVRNGGWILGDDYVPDPDSHQHGVFRAVNDTLDKMGGTLTLNQSRQFGFEVVK
jgi:hypothetical protein